MKFILKPLDDLLNSLTMYRLLLYGLLTLAVLSIGFGYLGTIGFAGNLQLLSLLLLVITCYGANWLLGKLYKAPTASESALITAFILFFILSPARDIDRGLFIFFAGLVAMASKYVLAFRNKHIFNPAAFGACVVGLLGFTHASWWVGNKSLFPFVLLFGFLIIRKLKREWMLGVFALVALVTTAFLARHYGSDVVTILKLTLLSGPLLFFGSVMLTEPLTTPPTQNKQILYGIVAALLLVLPLHTDSFSVSPEMSLLLANLLSYGLSFRQRLTLTLKQKMAYGSSVFDFAFTPNARPQFHPGQYFEWTLPHRMPDGRGNRRYFTIASSPTESEIHLGVKMYEPSSSFKKKLAALEPGDKLAAGQLGGDFTLPKDPNEKLVFLAGGIGITPFRSMVKYLIDTKETRDIALFYSVSSEDEIAYPEIWEQGREVGVRTYFVLSGKIIPAHWEGLTGFLTWDALAQLVADAGERTFYLSGPPGMVNANREMLKKMSVKNIITDYFPGY